MPCASVISFPCSLGSDIPDFCSLLELIPNDRSGKTLAISQVFNRIHADVELAGFCPCVPSVPPPSPLPACRGALLDESFLPCTTTGSATSKFTSSPTFAVSEESARAQVFRCTAIWFGKMSSSHGRLRMRSRGHASRLVVVRQLLVWRVLERLSVLCLA